MSELAKFAVPAEFKSEFTPDELNDMKKAFMVFDIDGSGSIDEKELKAVLEVSDCRLLTSPTRTHTHTSHHITQPHHIPNPPPLAATW